MIYLDNAATSHPKAPGVAAAVARCLEEGGSSPSRASHRLARAASRTLFEAREACAAFLGAEDGNRLIFTRNATEALNLAILGAVPPGGTVAVSTLEHNAVMRPVRHLERTRGVRVLVAPFDGSGRPEAQALERVLGQRPDLMVLTTASNVTGGLTPAGDVAERCARLGIRLCLDASQTVGHFDPPVGCAYLAFSGHKGLLGPAGTGGLLLGPGSDPAPLLFGGTGSASEREDMPDVLPDRFEAGTPNLPGIAGLQAALGFLAGAGLRAVREREASLCDDLLRGLLALPGIRVHGPGPGESRAPVISISVADRDLGELALELDRRDICTRVGLHCAPAAHRGIGTFEAGGTLRFSPGFFNTGAELRATLEALEEILT
jgi:cysteine desulfurase family protein